MSDFRLIGLDGIAVAKALVNTAGMPAVMVTITAIVPDSAVFAIAMPGKTELMVEDSDFADITINTAGEKLIEWGTRDMKPANFCLGMGGTSGATFWKAPAAAVIVKEKAIRLLSKTYNGKTMQIDVVHANLRAGGDLRFSKTESGMLSFQADILRPIQASTDVPIYISEI